MLTNFDVNRYSLRLYKANESYKKWFGDDELIGEKRVSLSKCFYNTQKYNRDFSNANGDNGDNSVTKYSNDIISTLYSSLCTIRIFNSRAILLNSKSTNDLYYDAADNTEGYSYTEYETSPDGDVSSSIKTITLAPAIQTSSLEINFLKAAADEEGIKSIASVIAYEIEANAVKLLDACVEVDEDIIWNSIAPEGVSWEEYSKTFGKIIEISRNKIYKRTGKKVYPNFMIVGECIVPYITNLNNYKGVGTTKSQFSPTLGYIGSIGNIKIYSSNLMDSKQFIMGVNRPDMMSCVGVFAPCNLCKVHNIDSDVQYVNADYDMVITSPELVIKGRII